MAAVHFSLSSAQTSRLLVSPDRVKLHLITELSLAGNILTTHKFTIQSHF